MRCDAPEPRGVCAGRRTWRCVCARVIRCSSQRDSDRQRLALALITSYNTCRRLRYLRIPPWRRCGAPSPASPAQEFKTESARAHDGQTNAAPTPTSRRETMRVPIPPGMADRAPGAPMRASARTCEAKRASAKAVCARRARRPRLGVGVGEEPPARSDSPDRIAGGLHPLASLASRPRDAGPALAWLAVAVALALRHRSGLSAAHRGRPHRAGCQKPGPSWLSFSLCRNRRFIAPHFSKGRKWQAESNFLGALGVLGEATFHSRERATFPRPPVPLCAPQC